MSLRGPIALMQPSCEVLQLSCLAVFVLDKLRRGTVVSQPQMDPLANQGRNGAEAKPPWLGSTRFCRPVCTLDP